MNIEPDSERQRENGANQTIRRTWPVRFQEWPFNWDCATLSHWSPANCKSRFQIISPHSAGSVCHFWHCQSSDPPVHPLIPGHYWDYTLLVWIRSHWSVFQGGLGRGYQKYINWLLGFPRDWFLDPSSSPHTLHHWVPSYRHMASPTISWNLGVIFDDQLTFKEHIAKNARSCRFVLHNIRKIRPFLTEHFAQPLVQALVISRLDCCNALLAGLPSNTIKPLQMIQNAAARLVFNEPTRAHVTPLFISLHWLPVAARIKFKTMMLAYKTTTGSAPTYFHSLLRIYIPSRSLRSASERRSLAAVRQHIKVHFKEQFSQRCGKCLYFFFFFFFTESNACAGQGEPRSRHAVLVQYPLSGVGIPSANS